MASRAAARTARREVRTPTARPHGVARAVAAGSGVPMPGAGFVGPHPKTATVERREEVPVAPRGQVVARRRRDRRIVRPVGAPSTPHRGDGIAAVATAAGAKFAGGRTSEGTCEETDKPGRSNAPRERRNSLFDIVKRIPTTAHARAAMSRAGCALPSRVPGERASASEDPGPRGITAKSMDSSNVSSCHP